MLATFPDFLCRLFLHGINTSIIIYNIQFHLGNLLVFRYSCTNQILFLCINHSV
jgi:hypothetical protein